MPTALVLTLLLFLLLSAAGAWLAHGHAAKISSWLTALFLALMAMPAIIQPITCSMTLPMVKSSGNMYQFQ